MKAPRYHQDSVHAMRLVFAVAALMLAVAWASATRAQEPAGGEADRIHISASAAAGALIEKSPPVYPPIAKAAGVQGTVVLDVTIDKTGAVEDLKVVSGHPMLQQAALDAVKTWRYKPFQLNGDPVTAETTVNVIFALAPEGNNGGPAEPPAATGAASAAGEKPAFRVGGQSIAIPAPTGEMIEVGSDHRVLFEVIVPDVNRLVAAFLLQKDAAALGNSSSGVLTPYALVEVLRQGEFAEISGGDFKQLSTQMGQQLGAIMESSSKETQEEFDRRMKALNLDEKITYGQPVMLGTLFAEDNASGFGILAPVTMNGTSAKMVAAVILFRAKGRILFAYLYAKYESEATTDWVRKVSRQWADAILSANEE